MKIKIPPGPLMPGTARQLEGVLNDLASRLPQGLSQVLQSQQGGLFTGDANTEAAINKPLVARITSNDSTTSSTTTTGTGTTTTPTTTTSTTTTTTTGTGTTTTTSSTTTTTTTGGATLKGKVRLYGWIEQIPDPSSSTGWSDKPGGKTGTVDRHAAFERNDNANVPTGTIVNLYRAYFDPTLDWTYVFDYAGSALPTTATTSTSRTTSTTQTACAGTCRWTWNTTTCQWDLDSSTCTNCFCTEPQRCGGECGQTSEQTVTSCATSPGNLQPLCCQTTTSSTTTTTGTGTTTTSTSTTTTTTTVNGLCTYCEWAWSNNGWSLVYNGCADSPPACNPCPVPNLPEPNPANCDVNPKTSCVGTTQTTTTHCACNADSCLWYWPKNGTAWQLVIDGFHGCSGDCGSSYHFGMGGVLSPSAGGGWCTQGGTVKCCCDAPSYSGTDCSYAGTNCYQAAGTTQTTTTGTGTTTTTQTTTTTRWTTTTGTGCAGFCRWQWNTTAGVWALVCTNCPNGCVCIDTPGYSGTTNNQTADGPCREGTTTTTSTSSTTSTTTTGCPGCLWQCQNFGASYNWVLQSSDCPAGCDPCSFPLSDCTFAVANSYYHSGCKCHCGWQCDGTHWQPITACPGGCTGGCLIPPNNDFNCLTAGQRAYANCGTTTTSTTSTTCTTTTVAPATCGYCLYTVSGGMGQLVNMVCTSTCVCIPAESCVVQGTAEGNYYITYCVDPGTTTSTTSTTTTTTTTTLPSDRRLKKNLRLLKRVGSLSVYAYNMLWSPNITSVGVLAQEVYKIYPSAVVVGGEDEMKEPWLIDYDKLFALVSEKDAEQLRRVCTFDRMLK